MFFRRPLISSVHHYVSPNETLSETLFSFCFSSIMNSIVSFELDDTCVLPGMFDDRVSFFPRPNQLTHIRITLLYSDDCICLLKEIGPQLCSFTVNIIYIDGTRFLRIYQIPTINHSSFFEISLNQFLGFLSEIKILVNDSLSKFC